MWCSFCRRFAGVPTGCPGAPQEPPDWVMQKIQKLASAGIVQMNEVVCGCKVRILVETFAENAMIAFWLWIGLCKHSLVMAVLTFHVIFHQTCSRFVSPFFSFFSGMPVKVGKSVPSLAFDVASCWTAAAAVLQHQERSRCCWSSLSVRLGTLQGTKLSHTRLSVHYVYRL